MQLCNPGTVMHPDLQLVNTSSYASAHPHGEAKQHECACPHPIQLPRGSTMCRNHIYAYGNVRVRQERQANRTGWVGLTANRTVFKEVIPEDIRLPLVLEPTKCSICLRCEVWQIYGGNRSRWANVMRWALTHSLWILSCDSAWCQRNIPRYGYKCT
jgi:hypothetical protein